MQPRASCPTFGSIRSYADEKKRNLYSTHRRTEKAYAKRRDWKESTISIVEGEEIVLETLLQNLVDMGYIRQPMVTAPGEFALRGGIIDIYPLYLENPIRIELFDTEVDSIRTFSAEDQRSLEKLKDIRILPATEYVLTENKKKLTCPKIRAGISGKLKKSKAAGNERSILSKYPTRNRTFKTR